MERLNSTPRPGRPARRRLERREKHILLKTENIDVVEVRQIDLLTPLIVKQEPEEPDLRMRLNILKILK